MMVVGVVVFEKSDRILKRMCVGVKFEAIRMPDQQKILSLCSIEISFNNGETILRV